MSDSLIDLDVAAVVAAAFPRGITDSDPGLVVGLYRGGELQDWWAAGLASLEYSVPISNRSVFDIASCSKQFTATVALLLADDGLVDLDADVRGLVPELQLPGVTLRRCLTHTTGLNDYMTANELAGRSLGDMVDQKDFVTWLGSSVTPYFSPGTSISYSNTGYVLAATLLSRATDTSFSDLIRERIFEPLGMTSTRLHDQVGVIVPEMAFSYSLDGERLAREEMVECQVGDGAVLTTVEDLAPWHRFLLDGHGLGVGVREQLLTRARLSSGAECGYAMGIQHRDIGGVPAFGHGGSMYGFRSAILCLPSAGVGISVLANWGDLPVQTVTRELASRVLGQSVSSASTRAPALAPTPSPPPAAPSAGRWVDVENCRLFDLAVEPESVTVTQLRAVLRPVHGTWQDDYDDFELVVDGDRLTLIDRMGSTATLQRTPDARVDPASLAGRYHARDLDTVVTVAASDDGTPRLSITGGPAWGVLPGYQVGGSEIIPLSDGGQVVRDADGRLTLSIWEVAVALEPVAEPDA